MAYKGNRQGENPLELLAKHDVDESLGENLGIKLQAIPNYRLVFLMGLASCLAMASSYPLSQAPYMQEYQSSATFLLSSYFC